MTRPGDRLRRLASQFCSAETMERLVDPIVADLQSEHAEAAAAGRHLKACLVTLGGPVTLVRGLCFHITTAPGLRAARDGFAVGAAAFAASVAVYVGPVLLQIAPMNTNASRVELAMYLVPGVIPAALSFAMLCGTACGLHHAVLDVRAMRRLFGYSLVAALAALAVSGWLMPVANQAFRLAAAGRPLRRGLNELSLGEVRALLARTNEPVLLVGPLTLRVVEAAYHVRWMLACLPIVAAAFGAAVARHRAIVRVLAAIGFLVSYNVYYIAFLHQQEGGALVSGTIPVWLLVWAPSLVVAAVSVTTFAIDARLDASRP